MRIFTRFTLMLLVMSMATLATNAWTLSPNIATEGQTTALQQEPVLNYDIANSELTLTWPAGTKVKLGSAAVTLQGYSGSLSLFNDEDNILMAYVDLPNGDYILNIPANAIIVDGSPMPATTYPLTVSSTGTGGGTGESSSGTITVEWPVAGQTITSIADGGMMAKFTTDKFYSQMTVELRNVNTKYHNLYDLPMRYIDKVQPGTHTCNTSTPGTGEPGTNPSWVAFNGDDYELVIKGFVNYWDVQDDKYDAIAIVSMHGESTREHDIVSSVRLVKITPETATEINISAPRAQITKTRDNIIIFEFTDAVSSMNASRPGSLIGGISGLTLATAPVAGSNNKVWTVTIPKSDLTSYIEGEEYNFEITAKDKHNYPLNLNDMRSDYRLAVAFEVTEANLAPGASRTLGTPAFSLASGTQNVSPATSSINVTFPEASGFDRSVVVKVSGTLTGTNPSSSVVFDDVPGTLYGGVEVPVTLSAANSYVFTIKSVALSDKAVVEETEYNNPIGTYVGSWSTRFSTVGASAQTETTLAFTSESATITAGETLQLAVTSNVQNAPVVYSSSDENVAAVDAQTGLVTAVASGNATITAYISETADHTEAYAFCDITVLPAQTFSLISDQTYPAADQKIKSLSGETFTFVFNEPVKRVQITVVDNTTGQSVTTKVAEVAQASTTIQYYFDPTIGSQAVYALSPAHEYSVNWIAYYSYNSTFSNKKAGEGSIRIIGDDENAPILSPTVEFESIDRSPDSFLFSDANGTLDHIDLTLTFRGEGRVQSVEAWVQAAQSDNRPQKAVISADGKTVIVTISTSDVSGCGACAVFVRAKDADGHIIGAPGESVNPNNGYLQFSYASEIGLAAPSLTSDHQLVNQIAELQFVNPGGISLNQDASGSWSRIQIVDNSGNVVATNFAASQFSSTGGGSESHTTITLTLDLPITEAGQYSVILPYAAFILGQEQTAKLNGSKTYIVTIDGTMGIDAVSVSADGSKTYSISGQPARATTPGIYIINGRKVAVKFLNK